jgi:hypothetical protein
LTNTTSSRSSLTRSSGSETGDPSSPVSAIDPFFGSVEASQGVGCDVALLGAKGGRKAAVRKPHLARERGLEKALTTTWGVDPRTGESLPPAIFSEWRFSPGLSGIHKRRRRLHLVESGVDLVLGWARGGSCKSSGVLLLLNSHRRASSLLETRIPAERWSIFCATGNAHPQVYGGDAFASRPPPT